MVGHAIDKINMDAFPLAIFPDMVQERSSQRRGYEFFSVFCGENQMDPNPNIGHLAILHFSLG